MMSVSALPRDTLLTVMYLDAVASLCLSVSSADPEFNLQERGLGQAWSHWSAESRYGGLCIQTAEENVKSILSNGVTVDMSYIKRRKKITVPTTSDVAMSMFFWPSAKQLTPQHRGYNVTLCDAS